MVAIEDLLKEYEKADMKKRLHMYLWFRDLRPMFFEKECSIIYQELGPHSARQKAKRGDLCCPDPAIHGKSSNRFWDRLLSVCFPCRLPSRP